MRMGKKPTATSVFPDICPFQFHTIQGRQPAWLHLDVGGAYAQLANGPMQTCCVASAMMMVVVVVMTLLLLLLMMMMMMITMTLLRMMVLMMLICI